MVESKPDSPSSFSVADKDVKAPNVFERTMEEIEAVLHSVSERQSREHNKETHGLRNDINENTPVSDVKAPTLLERTKEEIEAVVQTIHSKNESGTHHSPSNNQSWNGAIKPESKPDCHSEKDLKSLNLIDRAKEEIEAMIHKEKPPIYHKKETHGMNNDINENTPIGEIKGPSVFERAKEEIEALVQTIHPKEKPSHSCSPEKEGGFWTCLGRLFENCCSTGHKKD